MSQCDDVSVTLPLHHIVNPYELISLHMNTSFLKGYVLIFFAACFFLGGVPGSMFSCFSAFLLLCFSVFLASLLFCFSVFLLLCFSASLLLCFSAFCFPVFCFSCFSAFLLLCFFAFLLFASLFFVFPASLLFMLLCFSGLPASFIFCFSALPFLLCFSVFPASCTSVPFYFYYSTFSFLQSCVFAAVLPAPLLLCFLSLLFFFSFLLICSLLFVSKK